MKKTIIITLILLSICLFSGCIDTNITGTYMHADGAYFILSNDMTFKEKFKEGYTASGKYEINEKNGNLTLTYIPWGGFRVMTKTKNGYMNDIGGIYEKQK